MAEGSRGVVETYNPRYLPCGCLIWDDGIFESLNLNNNLYIEGGVATNHEFFDARRGLPVDYSSAQFFVSLLWRSADVGGGVRFTGGNTVDASIDNHRFSAIETDATLSISPFIGIEGKNGLGVRVYPQNLNLSRLANGPALSSSMGVELSACLDKACTAWMGVGAYISPQNAFERDSDRPSRVFFRIGSR